MADTLIKLIMDIQNNLRIVQKKSYNETELINSKLLLLYNNLQSEFKDGVEYKYFTDILHNEIVNCMLYDLEFYDYIVINIGLETLYSLIKNKNIVFSDKSVSISIADLHYKIIDIVSVYFYKESIIILFEYSDNEGRIIVKKKDKTISGRPNIKFIKFPLYNFKMINSELG